MMASSHVLTSFLLVIGIAHQILRRKMPCQLHFLRGLVSLQMDYDRHRVLERLRRSKYLRASI